MTGIDIVKNCIESNNLNSILKYCKLDEFGTIKIGTEIFRKPGIIKFYLFVGFIYFLVDNKNIVYIGRSKNYQRLYDHLEKDYDSVYFILFDNEQYIDGESLLLKKFKPKYNKCKITKKYHKENCC
jgi:hypothetical protein